MGGFAAMRKAAANSEQRDRDDEAKRDADFNKRVSTQQFLNQVTPIFKVYASGGIPADQLVEGTGLRDYAEAARRLAVSVVARLTDTMPNAVDPAMVRILLPPMAEFVARRIEVGIPVDVAADTDRIVATLDLVDPKFDTNPYERNPVPHDVSLKMTAGAGISTIMAQLAWYDFRAADVTVLAARLLDAVMTRSASVVMQIAADLPERDRVSLMQSFIKHHSEIMASVIANTASRTLAALKDLTSEAREAWYRDNDPIGEAVARFEVLTGALGGALLTWDMNMKDAAAVVAQTQVAPGNK